MNLLYLVLGVGFMLLGVIGTASSRQGPNARAQGAKARSSTVGTLGMFFLGLGLVIVILGL